MKQRCSQLRLVNYFTKLFLWGLFLTPSVSEAQTVQRLFTPCYSFGGYQGSTIDALVAIPAKSTAGPWVDGLPQDSIRHLATHGQIGSTWGLAFDKYTQKLYAAAYIKRHTSLGPYGTGAIYQVDPTGATAPSLFVDLNALFGANTAGVNPHGYTSDSTCLNSSGGYDNFSCWFNDVRAWDAVGRQGLGDLDISEDGQFLYVMNMTNKTLYKIPTTNPNATNIQTFAFPVALPGAAQPCNSAGVRPMALGVKNGLVYAGALCSGEPTADGGGYGGDYIYIYALNPSTGTWTLKLEGNIAKSLLRNFTWRTGYVGGYQDNGKAIFTDIDFDNQGGMFIGIRDLAGDKYGSNAGKPIVGDGSIITISSTRGNILKACYNGSTGKYDLEVNGSCGGITTAGGATGQGLPYTNTTAKEYFFEDQIDPASGKGAAHPETSLGGIAYDTLTGELWVTSYDLNTTYQQGVAGMSNATGARTSSMIIIEDSSPSSQFGKVNGLGDLELSSPPPVTCTPITTLDTITCKGLANTNGFDYILSTTQATGGTWSVVPSNPAIFIDQDPLDPLYVTIASGMQAGTTVFVYDNGTCTDTIKLSIIMEPTICTTTTVFDTLSVDATVTVSNSTTSVASTTQDAVGIVGGEVDIKVEDLSGQTTYQSQFSIYNTYNTMEWINGPGDFSKATVTWDGNDNDANTLNATGLGGINLSTGGNFGFLANTDIGKLKITLRIYTDASNYSESVFTYNQSGTQYYNIPVEFTNFTVAGGTGADMTNVGAVQMIFEPLNLLTESNGIDFSLSCFHTPCVVIPCMPPTLTSVAADTATCTNGVANSNAAVHVAGIVGMAKYAYSTNGTTGLFASTATASTASSINLTGLATPSVATTYTFRIWGVDTTCYNDTTVVLNKTTCPPCGDTFRICQGQTLTVTTQMGLTNIQWKKDGNDLVGETNPSLTISSTGVYTVTGNDLNGCAAYLCCPIVVLDSTCCIVPTIASIAADTATCTNGVANNNAMVAIRGIVGMVKYVYGTNGTTNLYYANAIASTADSIKLTGIVNPTVATTYTFRIYSTDSTCYNDTTIILNPSVCPQCTITGTFTQNNCNDNSTTAITTDDYFTVTVSSVSAVNGGSSGKYEVVLNGTTVLNTGGTVYGTPVTVGGAGVFAANGTTTYSLTIRDFDNHTCTTTTFTTTATQNCSVIPCPPKICVPVTVTRMN